MMTTSISSISSEILIHQIKTTIRY